jgi:hypothetical protein
MGYAEATSQEAFGELGDQPMKVRAIFERATDGRWLTDAPELSGCSVSGQSIAEARLFEALAIHAGRRDT